ncbi:MAG: respiratory nitrate reductase subunit gamma [Candidatus Hodarchaeota archaeon]
MLDTFIYIFFLIILPYITVIIFFGGLIYKLISWLRTPRPDTVLTIYPKPNDAMIGPTLALDETIFPRLFSNKILWIFAILLHGALVVLLFGHVRLFGEPSVVWGLMGLDEQGVNAFAAIMGGAVGIIFMIAILGLLIRRFSGTVRTVSVPMDYLFLLLLLGIALSGNFMRFVMHLSVPELQTYFSSLVIIQPTLTPTVYEPAFIIHYLFAQILLIYLPFSKLIHVIGSIFTNYLVKR